MVVAFRRPKALSDLSDDEVERRGSAQLIDPRIEFNKRATRPDENLLL
jgi:hypothetical protein